MAKAIRERITYANVMSTVAVFVAIGGGAYAANKIGAKDIKKGAVRAKAIKKNAVKSKHIRNEKVKTADLADDAVTGAKTLEASLGTVPSAQHAQSAAQAANADNASKLGGHAAGCPAGMVAVEGICYDADHRPTADWPTAHADCADERKALPSVGEVARALGAFEANGLVTDEWTDSFGVDGSSYAVTVNTGNGTVAAVAITANLTYRCVTPLVR